MNGSGGLGAVSAGFSEALVEVLVLGAVVLLLIGLWKLAKVILAALS